MTYSFQKYCFDSGKIGLVKECNRISCILNGSHNFDLFFHRNNDESFYCVNIKRLGSMGSVYKMIDKLCPNNCNECTVCKEFAVVFENLQDAYFFSPNKDKNKPVKWKVFLKVEINLKNLE